MAHNCPFEALQDVLFVQADGAITLRASLAPVAAWLVNSDAAPWRMRLASLIVETAPEIHFQWGDPAALTVEYRKRVLAAIVRKYRGRDYVAIDVSLDALARVADTALSEDISTYLTDADVSESLKADLLMIVMEGRLPQCIDSVLEVFGDRETSERLRRYCVIAIRDAGTHEHRQRLAETCRRLQHIDNQTLGYLFETLFPACLSVSDALHLLQRASSVSRYDVTFLNAVKAQLAKSLNEANAMLFLRGFAGMILREPISPSLRVSEQFHWVSDLIPLCLSAALAMPTFSETDIDTIFDAVLLVEHGIMFGGVDNTDIESNRAKIRKVFAAKAELRRVVFWRRVYRYRASQSGKEPPTFGLNPDVSRSPT
jgi:hypothetical protein